MAEGGDNILLTNNTHSIHNHIDKEIDTKDGPLYDKLEPPPKQILHSLRQSPARETETHDETNHHVNNKLSPIKETEMDNDREQLTIPSKETVDAANHNPHTDEITEENPIEEKFVVALTKTPIKAKKQRNTESVDKGLLDQPLELTGKRERKSIERLKMPVASSQKKQPISVAKGTGTELGLCGQVEKNIQKAKPEELKLLHKILFGVVAQASLLRKHIRKFNGFDFNVESDEYKKKVELLNKLTVNNLKDVCNLLSIQKGSGKDEIIPRLMEYLIKPSPVEKLEKKKRTSGSNKKANTVKDDKSSKKTKTVSSKKQKVAADTIALPSEPESDEEEVEVKGAKDKNIRKKLKFAQQEDDEVNTTEPEAPSDGDEDDDFSEKSSPKKRKKATPKKKEAKSKTPSSRKKLKAEAAVIKTPKEKGSKATPKKIVSSGPIKNKAVVAPNVIYTDTEDEAASDKEEKKTKKRKTTSKSHEKEVNSTHNAESAKSHEKDKKGATENGDATYPSEDEIKGTVQDILEGANLMEITMKTVCKKVYDKFSSHDLTPKKDFIKETVKSLIS